MKKILRPLAFLLINLGFNLNRVSSYKYFFKYIRDKNKWIKQGGRITKNSMILFDYFDKAGAYKGHYFHQDLLVSRFIYENKPKRHIDIASRIDGFVAHVASFREIEVIDIRPLPKSVHNNIKFRQADLINSQNLGKTDSISCLHAIEHFGLGRYSDPIDVDGHNKGIANLVNLVSERGKLYISFPIGKVDEVHFNAHRIFKVDTIFKHPSIKKFMRLVRFDYVDDNGELHLNINIDDIKEDLSFGCGIYTFEKKIKQSE